MIPEWNTAEYEAEQVDARAKARRAQWVRMQRLGQPSPFSPPALAGYRIIPQAALNELEQEAREADCSYHFGWIVGWLDKHAPDLPAQEAK